MSKPLIITICLLISATLGFFVIYPRYQVLGSESDQYLAKSRNFESRKAYYRDLAEINEELEKYNKELSKIDLAIPKEISAPVVFDFFQKEIAQSGLVLKNLGALSSSPSLNYPGFSESSLSFSVSGPYEVFKNFLASLEKSVRLVGVTNMSFSSPKTVESSFTINLSVNFYSY